MKVTEKQSVEVSITHEEIVEWARELARKEVQRVVGTKKVVDSKKLDVWISNSGPGMSGQPSRYSIRVMYNDAQQPEAEPNNWSSTKEGPGMGTED